MAANTSSASLRLVVNNDRGSTPIDLQLTEPASVEPATYFVATGPVQSSEIFDGNDLFYVSTIADTPKMANPTREEIDAKLAVVEARAETRFVELGGKMDRVADSIESFKGTVTAELAGVRTELATVKADNKFTRLTIVIAVIGSAIAGLGALWVTQANQLAAFSTGLLVHETTAPPPAPGPTTTPPATPR
jgi:hypothetical protein